MQYVILKLVSQYAIGTRTWYQCSEFSKDLIINCCPWPLTPKFIQFDRFISSSLNIPWAHSYIIHWILFWILHIKSLKFLSLTLTFDPVYWPLTDHHQGVDAVLVVFDVRCQDGSLFLEFLSPLQDDWFRVLVNNKLVNRQSLHNSKKYVSATRRLWREFSDFATS